MAKKAQCRLGRHKWVKRQTAEGHVYGECTQGAKREWGRFDSGVAKDGGAPSNEGTFGVWLGQPPSPGEPKGNSRPGGTMAEAECLLHHRLTGRTCH
jgi:hypothetical protein